VQTAVDAVRGAWRLGAGDFGYTVAQRAGIERHMKRVPLLA
jgi:hypothetical protein